jgi:hypothetical protein
MKFDLSKSKSTWGGIAAIAILLVRQILIHNGVIIPYQEWDLAILLIDAVAAAFGIYGFRDAIRKLQVDQYYNDPLKKNIPKNENDNLGILEQEYQDKQYQDNERVTFSDQSNDPDEYKKDKKIIAACTLSGEPTFCLRGQDALAIDTISHYIYNAKRHCTPGYVEELESIYSRFKSWRDDNKDKMKIPD